MLFLFLVWLLSITVFLRFILAVLCINRTFLFIAKWYPMILLQCVSIVCHHVSGLFLVFAYYDSLTRLFVDIGFCFSLGSSYK